MFPAGTIVWRGGLNFSTSPAGVRACLSSTDGDLERHKTDRGTYSLRVVVRGIYLSEPEVTTDRSGIVCFVEGGSPPAGWTHLLVSRQRLTRDDHGCDHGNLFARFARPFAMEDYLRFRTEMAQVMAQVAGVPFSRELEAAAAVRLPEDRDGERRLVSGLVGRAEALQAGLPQTVAGSASYFRAYNHLRQDGRGFTAPATRKQAQTARAKLGSGLAAMPGFAEATVVRKGGGFVVSVKLKPGAAVVSGAIPADVDGVPVVLAVR
jgi:hypothetical protein